MWANTISDQCFLPNNRYWMTADPCGDPELTCVQNDPAELAEGIPLPEGLICNVLIEGGEVVIEIEVTDKALQADLIANGPFLLRLVGSKQFAGIETALNFEVGNRYLDEFEVTILEADNILPYIIVPETNRYSFKQLQGGDFSIGIEGQDDDGFIESISFDCTPSCPDWLEVFDDNGILRIEIDVEGSEDLEVQDYDISYKFVDNRDGESNSGTFTVSVEEELAQEVVEVDENENDEE